jgi:hypothetical protein
MAEILIIVEEAPEGSYTARSVGASIFNMDARKGEESALRGSQTCAGARTSTRDARSP